MTEIIIERKNFLTEQRRKALMTEATRNHNIVHLMQERFPSCRNDPKMTKLHKMLDKTLKWLEEETIIRERQLEKNR